MAKYNETGFKVRGGSLTEAQEQQAVVEWALYNVNNYPCLKWFHHIPNGGRRDKREAVKLKKQGVKAGVSDLHLPFPNKGYHGLYIEMKSENGRLSEKQAEFLEDMASYGFKTAVCFCAEAAIEVLEEYLR